MTPSPAPAPTEALTDEWMADTMFDHLAIIACEPDKWKRIDLFARFGHQVKATVEQARTPAAGVDRVHIKFAIATEFCPHSECGASGKCYGSLGCEYVKKADALLSSGILGESAQAAVVDAATRVLPEFVAPAEVRQCACEFKGGGVELACKFHGDLADELQRIAKLLSPVRRMPPSPPHDGTRVAAPHALEKVSTDV